MAEPIDFLPASGADDSVGRDVLERIVELFDSRQSFSDAWLGFLALKRRVDTPRRRSGAPMQRCGPTQCYLGK